MELIRVRYKLIALQEKVLNIQTKINKLKNNHILKTLTIFKDGFPKKIQEKLIDSTHSIIELNFTIEIAYKKKLKTLTLKPAVFFLQEEIEIFLTQTEVICEAIEETL